MHLIKWKGKSFTWKCETSPHNF